MLFALPLLLSCMVQQLYNTVDLIFAGNLIDANASAIVPRWRDVRAVALCYPVTWALTALGMMIVRRRVLAQTE